MILWVSKVKCGTASLLIGSAGDLEGRAEGFEVLLGVTGGGDEDMDAQGGGLDFLVFFQGSADGDDGEAEDLAGGEVDFRRDVEVLAEDADREAIFGGYGFQSDAGEDEEIGFADSVVGIVAGDRVRRADRGDEGFGKIAGECHRAGEDTGLEGFADFGGDFVVVCAVETERFVDGENRNGGGTCEEGEHEQGEDEFHGGECVLLGGNSPEFRSRS